MTTDSISLLVLGFSDSMQIFYFFTIQSWYIVCLGFYPFLPGCLLYWLIILPISILRFSVFVWCCNVCVCVCVFKFQKGFIKGEEFSSWLPLSSCCQDVAQLLSPPLGIDICPHPFLDELEGALVFGDLEQFHSMPLLCGNAAHLLDLPHELGVLGEVPAAVAVLRFTLYTLLSPWP